MHVNQGGGDDAADLERSILAFLWVLRDFAAQMRDRQGQPLMERQYHP